MKLTLGQIADWIHAEGVFDTNAEALGYSIDSRTIAAGELFFAVCGERVDGHDFVEAALADGAVAAVVSMRWLKPPTVDEAKLLRLPDSESDCVLHAMQKLAHGVRKQWGKRVIGVTGSAGKTTTKECIAQVLQAKFKVLKTEGNFNNHFGLPLTLLRLEPEHEVAVVEMGMNHAGEIAALAKIAEPDWAVVSNVGVAHAGIFADGIEGIARAKYELVESLHKDGKAFLNGDDERVAAMARGMGKRAVLYGTNPGLAVRAVEIEEKGVEGTRFRVGVGVKSKVVKVHLRLMGRHNVLNALAAVAVGLESGMQLAECCAALEQMRPTERRGNVVEWHGAMIVNDTYNSNPSALASMIGALKKTEAKRRILVAGEMLELGPEGEGLHVECGEATAGMDVVIGVRGLAAKLVEGAKAAGVAAEFVETPEAAGEWLKANLREGDVALLKASRGVRLERALEASGAGLKCGKQIAGLYKKKSKDPEDKIDGEASVLLYWLLYQKLFPYFRVLRVFRYVTFRCVFASLTALLIGLLIGPFVIERLRQFQIGQYIREEGPQSHQKKGGTPTMGGILICISVLVPTLLWSDLTDPFVWLVIFATLAFAAIGFADDYIKVVHKRNQGLTSKQKLVLQFHCQCRDCRYGAFGAATRRDLFDAVDCAVCEELSAGPDHRTFAACAHISVAAGIFAVHHFCDAGDLVLVECRESNGRAGWAGDRLHDHRRRCADGADVCERTCGLQRLPGVAEDAAGERADHLLRVAGGREHWVSLVQRAPGRDLYGRCRLVGAGRRHRDSCGNSEAGTAAAVHRRRVYFGGRERDPAGGQLQITRRKEDFPDGSPAPSF